MSEKGKEESTRPPTKPRRLPNRRNRMQKTSNQHSQMDKALLDNGQPAKTVVAYTLISLLLGALFFVRLYRCCLSHPVE